ncbi:MAG: GNAT family N-acetyltransferase [Candidatus Aenigmarchaeota archaeon]|nr:GNAT family N-acetyltransferase [Candidatus Aenigmarchaeota archaeon]
MPFIARKKVTKDMEKLEVLIAEGKDLSAHMLVRIDAIWQDAFPGNEAVDPKNRKCFAHDLFFVVSCPNDDIRAAGRLRPVSLTFMGTIYHIQGIADIVSVVHGKGYGKILMTAMVDYLKKKKQTGVGFCVQKNAPFYEKYGCVIDAVLPERFLYKNHAGKIIKNVHDEIVFSVHGNDGFMNAVSHNPREAVFIPCRHW